MTVIELLDELEDIVDTASAVPLTGRIVVEKNEILDLVGDIKRSLPDDVKQAQWLRNEQDRILNDAKQEYEKLLLEAKKQADSMVDNHEITLKAKKQAEQVNASADDYSRQMKMRTYDYLDKMIYDMQTKMQTIQEKYFNDLYNYCDKQFEMIEEELQKNRNELKQMASRTSMGEDWVYENDAEEREAGGSAE
ncbi:MAG: hypothetical protein IIY88_05875 [Eubacterium sp.]|nr:hypothetical protein [Eubacterium sp.]